MPMQAQPARELLAPLSAEEFGPVQARHLLWRAGFGGTPEQIDTMVAWGLEKAVDHLVDYQDIPTEPDGRDEFDKDIMRPPTPEERDMLRRARQRGDEDLVNQFREARQRAERSDRKQMGDVQRWWLKRMIQTPRPLEEKLTLFWHGHFATSYRSVEDSYHLYMQNRMLRGNALSYPALLRGIIRDPAMLAYLNNNRNVKSDPNENLAREIMELFSLGEGNYSEQDIKEGARALTGYTFEDDAFIFRENQHDNGAKQVLGFRGMANGDDFVNAILRHRACGPYMATRLYRFFVADVPGHPDQLDGVHKQFVVKLAARLERERFELGPVLKDLFKSRYFYSDAVVRSKIKSPVEMIVGAVRTLGVPARDLGVLTNSLEKMGQNLFYPPSVKGWDGGRSWINTATLFARQNTMVYLVSGRLPQGKDALAKLGDYDPRRAFTMLHEPGETPTARETVSRLLDAAIGDPDPVALQALTEAAETNGGIENQNVLAGLVLLITSMPEYQLC